MANDGNDATYNPHDRLFRDTFAHKESLIGFVRAYVPTELAALVNSSESVEPYPGTFVDPELKMSHSDIVYRFVLDGRPVYLYLLFEHQSTPEPDMAFRLLRYLVKLRDDIGKQAPGADKSRPPILPLVLYHGERKWNAARQFQDLIDLPPALMPYTPGFEYVLVDLNEPGMQDQVDDLRCRFVLHLMHAAATDTLLQAFQHHGQILTALWQALARGDSLRFLETVIRYAVSVADIDAHELKQIVVEFVNKEAGDIVMTTTAERWMAEGEARGEIRGEIKLLQSLIIEKFPEAPPMDLEGLALEQLETIGKRILTCETLDEVLEGIA